MYTVRNLSNREMKIIRKYQMELKKNNWSENTLEGFNSILDEAIEKIRELKDREMELSNQSSKKKKDWQKVKIAQIMCGATSSRQTLTL